LAELCDTCFEVLDDTGFCQTCFDGAAGLALLLTGDRHWVDVYAVESMIEYWKPRCVVLGDAKGLDTIAFDVATSYGVPIHGPFVADWTQYGRAAGPMRNADMLGHLQLLREAEGYEIRVIAFHEALGKSKGTRSMVKLALKAGIDVRAYGTKQIRLLYSTHWDEDVPESSVGPGDLITELPPLDDLGE
jgi:hypothetical protein